VKFEEASLWRERRGLLAGVAGLGERTIVTFVATFNDGFNGAKSSKRLCRVIFGPE
jgi:hypothetical protein